METFFGQWVTAFCGGICTVGNPQHDFGDLLNDETQTVPSGKSVRLKGNFPLLIDFDAGDGKVTRRNLPDGEYHVGVSPVTKLWDLLPFDSQTVEKKVASH